MSISRIATVMDAVTLGIGFFMSFLVTGFVIVELLPVKLPGYLKPACYLFFSVLGSTYLVYAISLLVGFSPGAVRIWIAVSTVGLAVVWRKNAGDREGLVRELRNHRTGLLLGLAIGGIFLTALYPAIFFWNGEYFVLAASNWQDTPLHLGIIQSLAQGNFPPLAPYFAGSPLLYYYFTDLHTAILEVLTNGFSPRILVLDDALFALMYAWALYGLGYLVTRRRLAGVFTMIAGVFMGNWMFIRLLEDLGNSLGHGSIWSRLGYLMSNRGYTMEYGDLMQMTPVADMLLQNRPLMMGLPGIVVVASLVLRGLERDDLRLIGLAGAVSGLLAPFQLLMAVLGGGLFYIGLVVKGCRAIGDCVRKAAVFSLPWGVFLFVTQFGVVSSERTMGLLEQFSRGPWGGSQPLTWYGLFFLTNFGLPFVVAIVWGIRRLPGRKRSGADQKFAIVFAWLLTLLIIPHLVTFTLYRGDMFKFFYVMFIAVAVLFSTWAVEVWRRPVGKITVIGVMILSSLSSAVTLVSSVVQEQIGYTPDQYRTGVWIRKNIPKQAIFIETPSIHTPTTQIGGRLRVLSYTTWPFTHGYGFGDDTVFSRQAEIGAFFTRPDGRRHLLEKYQVDFIYYGAAEREAYPVAAARLRESDQYRPVFQTTEATIYGLL